MVDTQTWAYEAFLSSLDHPDRRWADELDFTAIRQLDGAEKARATQVLLDRLAQGEDRRVPAALIEVAPRNIAEAALKQAMAQDKPASVAAAVALGELTGGGGKEALLRLLSKGIDPVLAAIGLQRYAGPDVDAVLLPQLERADGEMAHHLTEALWAGHQLARYATTGPGWGLRSLNARLWSPYGSIRRPAVAELRRLLDALAKGQDPATLGYAMSDPTPTAAYDQFVDSMRPDDTPAYDHAAASQLSGEERTRAEVLLIQQLDPQLQMLDARAPATLAAMRSQLAIDPLKALLPKATGKMRDEMAKALQSLTAPPA